MRKNLVYPEIGKKTPLYRVEMNCQICNLLMTLI